MGDLTSGHTATSPGAGAGPCVSAADGVANVLQAPGSPASGHAAPTPRAALTPGVAAGPAAGATAPGRLPGPVLTGADLGDQPALWPAQEIARLDGRLASFVTEDVTAPTGARLRRDWLRHPGAVAVIALDALDRIAVLAQYRHPAGARVIEPPAGLLDLAGESAWIAAQRELAEEARLRADDWRVLVDVFTSPGSSQESIRVFLARELHPVAAPAGFVAEGEEADMAVGWADLTETVAAILAGRLQSPTLVAGVLALWAARTVGGRGLDALRPPDAPWPARQAKLARD